MKGREEEGGVQEEGGRGGQGQNWESFSGDGRELKQARPGATPRDAHRENPMSLLPNLPVTRAAVVSMSFS